MIGAGLFQSVTGFAARLAASTGAALVGFLQQGAGAVLRTLQAKSGEWVSVADFGALGVSEAADNALFTAACTAIGNAGCVVNPVGSLANFATVAIPNGVLVIDMAGQRVIASNVASGKSTQAGGGHLLVRNVTPSTPTRMHMEPNGYVTGVASKLDLMFDPYNDDGTNYRIINCYTKTYDPADASTTQGNGGVAVLGVKGVGNYWGVWPVLHVGFSDDGASSAVPMKVAYFDTSDTVWRTPMKGAWRAGLAVTAGEYRTASNKIYQAATTGTTGPTVPSHAAGTVSDGTVNWTFVYAPNGNNVRAQVLFGDRDDMWKFGFPSARVQYAKGTVTWNGIKHAYLDGNGAVAWNSYTYGNTDDLYIETNDGARRLRLAASGQFMQTAGLAFCSALANAADGDTTPSIKGVRCLGLSNSAATTITQFTNGLANQEFYVRSGNGQTTIANGANIKLAGGVNRTMAAYETLFFVMDATGTIASQVVGEGAKLTGTTAYDPPLMGTSTQVSTNVAVAGAAMGDFVTGVSFSLDTQGAIMRGYVSAPGTVTVVLRNDTGANLDLGNGTLRVRVEKAV